MAYSKVYMLLFKKVVKLIITMYYSIIYYILIEIFMNF